MSNHIGGKQLGNLTVDQLKQLLDTAPGLLNQAESLLEAIANSEKLEHLIAEAPPRGPFYELPLDQLLATLLVAFGADGMLREAANSEDPQAAVINSFMFGSQLGAGGDLESNQQSAVLQMVLAVAYSLRCTATHGCSLCTLLSASHWDDKYFFDAVLIDQACLITTVAARKMDIRRGDAEFQKRLGRATSGSAFKRKSTQLDMPRLALALLHDGGALDSMTNSELHDLFVYQLKLEPYASRDDAFDAIAKLRSHPTRSH